MINLSKPLDISEVKNLSQRDEEISKIVKLVSPSVVSIRSSSQVPSIELEQGSGVIITEKGHVVTNYHVIDSGMRSGENSYVIELESGRLVEAQLLKIDSFLDLALLKINSDEKFSPIAFGDSDDVKVGHKVFAFGNPYGLGVSFSEGNIAAKNRFLSEFQQDLFQMTAPLNPGQSGGPLINVRGELIGINSSIYSKNSQFPGFQGIAFSIQSNEVKDSVKSMMIGESKVRGYLGVTVSELTDYQRNALGYQQSGGALVEGVYPQSPAAEAGIKPLDVVVSFDKKKIITPQHLIGLLKKSANQKVDIEVWSQGVMRTLFVTLTESEMVKLRGDEQSESMQNDILTNYGFEVQDLSSAEKNNIFGVKVKSVLPGTIASELGIKKGDYLLLVNGQRFNLANSFLDIFRTSVRKGDVYMVVYNPEGKYHRVRIPALMTQKK
ncbi:trypsin-like peptidase domain-containing protein [Akkermansiaceae bacterium]|nr:trypsin-like peptidase domain-containing protein [Akkermansiaceae bacterium]